MMIQWSVAVASTCLSALPQLSAQQIKTWILRSSWVMSDVSHQSWDEETKRRSNEEPKKQAHQQQNHKQASNQPSKHVTKQTIAQATKQKRKLVNNQTNKPKKKTSTHCSQKSLPCWVNGFSGNKIENTRSLVEWPLLWRYLWSSTPLDFPSPPTCTFARPT